MKYRGKGRENNLEKLNSNVSLSGKKRPSLKRVFMAGGCFSDLFLNIILKWRENIVGLKLLRSIRGFDNFLNSFLENTGKWDAMCFKSFNFSTKLLHAGLLISLGCKEGISV